MVGPGCAIDTDKYFVVCANVLGSCYGTCGPTSLDPDTGVRYGGSFPYVTVRDTVRLHALLLKEALGVSEVFTAIGGSMGGMQALEWAMQDIVPLRSGVVLAVGGRHNPWQIGVSELQRQAIKADPAYRGGNYAADAPPNAGISVARQIAMVSYRTHPVYCEKFGRDMTDPTLEGTNSSGEHTYKVEEYLR
jgi:homoserine O-acetyltransferase